MRILVLHRVPDTLVRYAESIDHHAHEVTYIGVPDRADTMPAGVPARRLSRPGTGPAHEEIIAALAGEPAPDVVIALSEYDLLTAARVREALGAPGPTEAEVLPYRDKVAMKAAVDAQGLRTPRFLGLTTALAAPDEVPWSGATVLKPLSGASSEGVTRHPGVKGALQAARSMGVDADEYEIEEFVEGPIIHVDGLVADGAAVTVVVSRYVNTCLAYAEGEPLGSVQIDTDPEVVDWVLRCLAAVNIATGPFHLEAIEGPDGLVFLEVGARFGGADVVDTFELATGVRLPSAQLRLLVEGASAHIPNRVPAPDARYGWFVWPGHTLGTTHCRVSGAEEFAEHPLVWRWVQRAADEPVSRTITYADAHVPLAGVTGPAGSDDMARLMAEMFAAVKVGPAMPENGA
ncbi:ATP-grasp domain-containing protein [Saccharothrix isguenensis]